jgi:uncharacterized protein (TIGR02266 family)
VSTAKTIVIADDVDLVRDRFTAAVEGAGHRAITVRSAAELLARIRADLPQIDLLVVDLQLPQTAGGVELVRAVRKIDEGRLPILVFSGTIATAQQVQQLTELGVAGYLNEYSAAEHIMPALAPHLFPDNFNRRSSPRVVLGISMAYRFDRAIAGALSLNVGKGGVAIRTMTPLDAGARARVAFRLPASKRELDAACRVAWSDRRVGMGMQFERLDPADQTAIDEFVDHHFFTPRKS